MLKDEAMQARRPVPVRAFQDTPLVEDFIVGVCLSLSLEIEQSQLANSSLASQREDG